MGDKASELLFKARTEDLEVNVKTYRWTPGLGKQCKACRRKLDEVIQHIVCGYNEVREQAMQEIK